MYVGWYPNQYFGQNSRVPDYTWLIPFLSFFSMIIGTTIGSIKKSGLIQGDMGQIGDFYIPQGNHGTSNALWSPLTTALAILGAIFGIRSQNSIRRTLQLRKNSSNRETISKLHAYAFTCQHLLRWLFEPSQWPPRIIIRQFSSISVISVIEIGSIQKW